MRHPTLTNYDTCNKGTLLFEYQRSSVKEQAKTQSEKEVFNALGK